MNYSDQAYLRKWPHDFSKIICIFTVSQGVALYIGPMSNNKLRQIIVIWDRMFLTFVLWILFAENVFGIIFPLEVI